MLTHVIMVAPHLLNRKLWDLSESETSSRRHVFINASSSGYMTDAMTRGGLSPYARPAQNAEPHPILAVELTQRGDGITTIQTSLALAEQHRTGLVIACSVTDHPSAVCYRNRIRK